MIWLSVFGFIYLLFSFLRLIIVLLNMISRPYLKNTGVITNATISVLIPARNEEQNIGFLLGQLLKQTYRVNEILVYDDQSTDQTAAIVAKFSKKHQQIKLINGLSLPGGWLGKNHACYYLAQQASGDYFLFLDADVIPKPSLIAGALARMQKFNLQLLSIFPAQKMETFGEKITVPLMHNILLSLLPLFYVRQSNRVSFSAANGQFMLFNARTYNKIQPHQWKKNKAVEDIEIVKLYKKFHYNCETLLGNNTINCRMYQGFPDAVNGFTKNIRSFFASSNAFMMFYTFFAYLGWLGWFALPKLWILVNITILIIYHVVLNIISGRRWQNLLYIPMQSATTFMISLWAIYANKKQSLIWKGRKI